jgi:hypothetical protein
MPKLDEVEAEAAGVVEVEAVVEDEAVDVEAAALWMLSTGYTGFVTLFARAWARRVVTSASDTGASWDPATKGTYPEGQTPYPTSATLQFGSFTHWKLMKS